MSRKMKVRKFYDSSQASQCQGKRAFASRFAAEQYRDEIYASERHDGATLNVYRCGHCRLPDRRHPYHVGRRPGSWG